MKFNKCRLLSLCLVSALTLVISGCSKTIVQKQPPSFTSIFPYENRNVGKYSVDNYTTAPLQWAVQAWINTDAATLYAKSLSLEGIAENVTWENESADHAGDQHMAGSVRAIPVAWMSLKEKLLLTDSPNVHFYTILSEESSAPTPMDHYLGVVTTEPIDEGSVITWRVYFDAKGLRSPMAGIMSSQIKSGLEKGFRTWIEEYGGTLIPVEVKK